MKKRRALTAMSRDDEVLERIGEEVARLLRGAFPQVEFELDAETYPGDGLRVRVMWSDGPRVSEVSALTSEIREERAITGVGITPVSREICSLERDLSAETELAAVASAWEEDPEVLRLLIAALQSCEEEVCVALPATRRRAWALETLETAHRELVSQCTALVLGEDLDEAMISALSPRARELAAIARASSDSSEIEAAGIGRVRREEIASIVHGLPRAVACLAL